MAKFSKGYKWYIKCKPESLSDTNRLGYLVYEKKPPSTDYILANGQFIKYTEYPELAEYLKKNGNAIATRHKPRKSWPKGAIGGFKLLDSRSVTKEEKEYLWVCLPDLTREGEPVVWVDPRGEEDLVL